MDEAGQVCNKLGKEEDGCEEGLQGGDVRLKAKDRVCLGEGTPKRRYGGRSPEGCYGPRLETPAPARVGFRGGTTGGSRDSPKSWSRRKVDLIWAISERREAETVAEGPEARIEVDGGPGPGSEKPGLTPGSEGRWVGGVLVAQLSITILLHPHPVLMTPLRPRARERVASLTAPPLPS